MLLGLPCANKCEWCFVDVRYPLAVKLGTITPNGADVYSYAPEEDSMVKVTSFASVVVRCLTLAASLLTDVERGKEGGKRDASCQVGFRLDG